MTRTLLHRPLQMLCIVLTGWVIGWLAIGVDNVSLGDEATIEMSPVPTSNNNMAMNAAVGIFDRSNSEVSRRLASYHSDANGRWAQPPVKTEPAKSVPLRLKTPHGIIRIKLSVTLDQLTPEESIEKLLDKIIQRAIIQRVGVQRAGDQGQQTNDSEPQPQKVSGKDDEAEESSVTATNYTRDSVLAKLERLVRATGAESADRDELKWMLEQWRPGPVWLIARDSVAPPHRLAEPLLSWLDVDEDGGLSKLEIEGFSERIDRLDTDRNGIVYRRELDSALARPGRTNGKAIPATNWSLAWDNSDSADELHSDLAVISVQS